MGTCRRRQRRQIADGLQQLAAIGRQLENRAGNVHHVAPARPHVAPVLACGAFLHRHGSPGRRLGCLSVKRRSAVDKAKCICAVFGTARRRVRCTTYKNLDQVCYFTDIKEVFAAADIAPQDYDWYVSDIEMNFTPDAEAPARHAPRHSLDPCLLDNAKLHANHES
ncbi:hypothetical protein F1609_31855 [Massilia sp. CCM 8693]|uniref:Uncharacterized protein n=1 Tax=Massilia aquatica TaxID=2609000 RepID=A0ABX0MKA3_9BURK|nr:hypothetical protein [Massilia aquatica]